MKHVSEIQGHPCLKKHLTEEHKTGLGFQEGLQLNFRAGRKWPTRMASEARATTPAVIQANRTGVTYPAAPKCDSLLNQSLACTHQID